MKRNVFFYEEFASLKCDHGDRDLCRVEHSDFSLLKWASNLAFPSTLVGTVRKTRLFARSTMNFRTSALWFKFLHTNVSEAHLNCNKNLFESIHRPFYDHRLSALARSQILSQHFGMLREKLSSEDFVDLMLRRSLSIAQWGGKSGEHFSLELFRDDRFKREGALSMGLLFEGQRILTLSFSFCFEQNELVIKVGGLQACSDEARDKIKAATQGLHGLQPRLFLIAALRSLSAVFLVQKIEAVATANHIHRALRYRLKKKATSDYDSTWTLAGGGVASGGNYSIPLAYVDVPVESRPANKRSMYRRRALMLNEISAQITEYFDSGLVQDLRVAA